MRAAEQLGREVARRLGGDLRHVVRTMPDPGPLEGLALDARLALLRGQAAQLAAEEHERPGTAQDVGDGPEAVPVPLDAPASVLKRTRGCLACGCTFPVNPCHAKGHRFCRPACRARYHRRQRVAEEAS